MRGRNEQGVRSHGVMSAGQNDRPSDVVHTKNKIRAIREKVGSLGEPGLKVFVPCQCLIGEEADVDP